MRKYLRKLVRSLYSRFENKAKWTSGAMEVLKLLEMELPLQMTTFTEVEEFLVNNRLDYYIEDNVEDIKFDTEISIKYILVFSSIGPILWSNFVPTQYHYTILCGFDSSKALVNIKVNMMDLHI